MSPSASVEEHHRKSGTPENPTTTTPTTNNRFLAQYQYFSTLVSSLPVRYCSSETGSTNTSYTTTTTPTGLGGGGAYKYMVNKKNLAPKQLIKDGTKRAKKLRLDPNKMNALEIQEENDLTANAPTSTMQSDSEEEEIDDDLNGSEHKNSSMDDVVETENNDQREGNTTASTTKLYPKGRATSIVDLRERLKNRIMQLRKNKGNKASFDKNTGKRTEKKLAEKNKQKTKVNNAEKSLNKKHEVGSNGSKVNGGNNGNKINTGSVVYSKFDFTETNNSKKKKNNGDLNSLLIKAEKQKEKLQSLKANDQGKFESVQDKLKQRKALEMAQGIKQTDDVGLLKKAIKRKEKKKQKSASKWSDRKKNVDKDLKQRIEKREGNLNKRIQEKKDKRINKGKGKSKKLGKKHSSGFEGKR